MYKQEVNGLRSALESHFSRVINSIEAGLPEIQEAEDKIEEDDVFCSA